MAKFNVEFDRRATEVPVRLLPLEPHEISPLLALIRICDEV